MNKIRIATNDMALTVKMSDEQANVWFGTLTRALLGEYPDIAEPVEDNEPETEETQSERGRTGIGRRTRAAGELQGLSSYHLCALRRNRQL